MEDTTARQGGRVAAPEPPAALRQLGGSSSLGAGSEAGLGQGLLVRTMTRGKQPVRSAELATGPSCRHSASITPGKLGSP